MKQPALFISHGAPDIVISPSGIRSFLISLGQEIVADKKPDAVVIVSAHHETDTLEVVSDPAPGMIYDFGGFQPELYSMVYPAPGSRDLAHEIQAILKAGEIEVAGNASRGYDHGSWTILKLMLPEADIPVVQVSVQPEKDARHHFEVGAALSQLRERNILTIGSGHITHNLSAAFTAMRTGKIDPVMAEKTDAFTDWIAKKLASSELEELLEWESRAPHALDNHPTPEHFFPLFFALGAGGKGAKATRLHTSKQYGFFTSDVWQFC